MKSRESINIIHEPSCKVLNTITYIHWRCWLMAYSVFNRVTGITCVLEKVMKSPLKLMKAFILCLLAFTICICGLEMGKESSSYSYLLWKFIKQLESEYYVWKNDITLSSFYELSHFTSYFSLLSMNTSSVWEDINAARSLRNIQLEPFSLFTCRRCMLHLLPLMSLTYFPKWVFSFRKVMNILFYASMLGDKLRNASAVEHMKAVGHCSQSHCNTVGDEFIEAFELKLQSLGYDMF